MTSSFEIDTTYGGLTALDALAVPLPDPQPVFNEYRKMIRLGDGSLLGSGPRSVLWQFPLLEPDQIAQLESFFSTDPIYITTRGRDDAFTSYEVIMTVPDPRQDGEHLFQGVRSGYTVEFIVLALAGD
jgi:hypothetical protein